MTGTCTRHRLSSWDAAQGTNGTGDIGVNYSDTMPIQIATLTPVNRGRSLRQLPRYEEEHYEHCQQYYRYRDLVRGEHDPSPFG